MEVPSPNTGNTAAAHVSEELTSEKGRVRRILFITSLAMINAVIVGGIAKLLVMLINVVTSIFFYGTVSVGEVSPEHNTLGYWVIAIPVIGGLIVGIMARFGSRAIRGHGIPEAMEKIITEESRIHPMITILKPLSAAISIGTGGPFGAEGPIISTGGALGSFCGQTLHITAQERKVLLAAGATAGMTAIFGTPFAAILLAIELLLFEFAAKSFLPVMMACITGACMHFVLFGASATFPMPEVEAPGSAAVFTYGAMGIVIGLASVFVTKFVYKIEDWFEKLPIHWMWWPAIGGVAVGVVGLFFPKTLGVGYHNITDALTGDLSVGILVSLCFWKFISWAIALGSGTSGGTLAPLLTIGSSMGCLIGIFVQTYFPEAGISLPLAALVGMAALFAGASRAILTSIVFAVETTMQESTLLSLIAGCSTAYLVSFVLMRSTIMTEKIKRRGILMPESYRPDLLEMKRVYEIMSPVDPTLFTVANTLTVTEVKQTVLDEGLQYEGLQMVVVGHNKILGFVDRKKLFVDDVSNHLNITDIMDRHFHTIYADNSLALALEVMLKAKQQVLPVIDRGTHELAGVITERDILNAFEKRFFEDRVIQQHISLPQKAVGMSKKAMGMSKKAAGMLRRKGS
ncbi:MAG TPA: chloride channel protein [Cyclobacteriaceae bacterium]|nr:chloride channel protein [Cyclobacteriaceae bacterium]